MQLHTTAKAHLALWPGTQTLTLRERSLLLLAQGELPTGRLRRLFHGMGEQIVTDMLREGYLAPGEAQPRPAARDADREPSAEPLDE